MPTWYFIIQHIQSPRGDELLFPFFTFNVVKEVDKSMDLEQEAAISWRSLRQLLKNYGAYFKALSIFKV